MSDFLRQPAFPEMQQLVKSSANEVIAALPQRSASEQGIALGHIASAFVDVEGVYIAHARLTRTLDILKLEEGKEELPEEVAFGVWTSLHEKGDTSALALARRAIHLDAELFIAPGFTMVRDAENIVRLVEAGDAESLPLAKDLAARSTTPTSRVSLFTRLYKAGDDASLDLAIAAAIGARNTEPENSEALNDRSEDALLEAARFAVRVERVDDALRIIGALESEHNRALIHAELYRQGRQASLDSPLRYLATHHSPVIERMLAEGGEPITRQLLEQRAARKRTAHWWKRKPTYDIDDRLEDLVALHKANDPSAASKVEEIVRIHRTMTRLSHLGKVGLGGTAVEWATEIYETEKSGENADGLLELLHQQKLHNNDVWKRAFQHHLREREDVVVAAAMIRDLGERAKTPEDGIA